MLKFKKAYLALLLVAPMTSFASNYCIAVNGGFGSGGSTFVAPNFTLPTVGLCKAWSGFTKTATSVILTTDGTTCLSTDGKVLTFALTSQNPNWLGTGQFQADYIRFCPSGTTSCPVTGRDVGNYGGPAKPVSCTSSLLKLPALHD